MIARHSFIDLASIMNEHSSYNNPRGGRVRLLLSLFLCLILNSNTWSQPRPEVETPDVETDAQAYKSQAVDWVERTPRPVFPEERITAIDEGIAYAMIENQIKLSESGHTFSYRLVYQVIDRSGLESAAQITISFDPTDSDIAFTDVSIIRDEERIDRLADTEIEIIRQEDELENFIVDGNLTAVINLQDLQVGDIVDYTYQGEFEAKLWPGHFFDRQSVEWSVPLTKLVYRVLAPEDTPIHYAFIESDLELEINERDGWVEYAFIAKDPEPLIQQSKVPHDYIQYGYFDLSTMSEWSEVSRWAVDIYEADLSLPDEVLAFTARLETEFNTDAERLIQALRYVQSEIRYLGLEGGLGSHMPRPPHVTMQRRYGDCKDKTVLLMAILREMGIEAHPALVNLRSGKTLDRRLPSIGAFDHVIVQAVLDGKTYWLDPTYTHQGGNLENVTQPDYGFVLPIQATGSDLQEILIELPDRPARETHESFTLPEEGALGFLLDIETVYIGYAADSIRRDLAESSSELMTRQYLDYYNQFYPGIRSRNPISVEDDFEANQIITKEVYDISRADFEAGEMDTKIWIVPHGIRNQLPERVEATRYVPMRLPYGTHVEHITELNLPGRMFTAPKGVTHEGFGVSFSKTYEAVVERFTTTFKLQVSERQVEIDDIAAFLKLSENISDATNVYSNPSAAGPTFARRLNLQTPLSAEFESRLINLNQMINQKKTQAALAETTRLIRTNPEEATLRGYLHMVKGALEIDLKRTRPAKVSLKKAFELYTPTFPRIYFQYASLLRRDGDLIETARIIELLFSQHPESIADINFDWLNDLLGELYFEDEFGPYDSLSIAVAKAQYAHREAFDTKTWIYAAAIEPLVEAGDLSTAEDLLDEVGDPEMLIELAMDQDNKALWDRLQGKIEGDALAQFTEDFIAKTKAEALAEPYDFKAQSRYLNALRQAARYEEAEEHGASYIQDWENIVAYGEDAQWFIDQYARAMMEAGRFEEALEVTERLLDPGLDSDSNLINHAINLSHRLWQIGRFEEAIDKVEALLDSETKYASDFGEMYLYAVLICSTTEAGESAKAKQIYTDRAAEIAAENLDAALSIHLCLGDVTAAEDVMIERLGHRRQRARALRMFAQPTRPWKNPDAVNIRHLAAYQELLKRPRIQEALAKYGRALEIDGPPEYWRPD